MLLDLTSVRTIDLTTARAIEDIMIDTKSVGHCIFLVGASPSVRKRLEKQQILQHFNMAHMYQSRLDALHYAMKVLG